MDVERWIEVRDDGGVFRGYFDDFLPDRSSVRVPVCHPFSAVWTPERDYKPEPLTIIDLQRCRWWDGRRLSWVMRVSDADVAHIPYAKRMVAAGAYELTEYGKWERYVEAMLRLVVMVRFYRWSGDGAAIN